MVSIEPRCGVELAGSFAIYVDDAAVMANSQKRSIQGNVTG